jgi:hypothetical protein
MPPAAQATAPVLDSTWGSWAPWGWAGWLVLAGGVGDAGIGAGGYEVRARLGHAAPWLKAAA